MRRLRPGALVAVLCMAGILASAPASAATTPPTIKGAPAFLDQSLATTLRQSSYMSVTTMSLSLGAIKTQSKVTAYFRQHAGQVKEYVVAATTVAAQGATQHTTSYTYEDAERTCSRDSAAAAWKCIASTAKAIQTAMLPFVSVTHVKLLGHRRVLGQEATGALLDLNLSAAAGTKDASGLTTALGNTSAVKATYWVATKSHLPIELSIQSSVSRTPITIVYSGWNSPKITIPQVP